MTEKGRVLIFVLTTVIFCSCNNKSYVTKNYNKRIDSLLTVISNSREELKSLKQEIITIIDDSTKTED